jgi:hypothetical protein
MPAPASRHSIQRDADRSAANDGDAYRRPTHSTPSTSSFPASSSTASPALPTPTAPSDDEPSDASSVPASSNIFSLQFSPRLMLVLFTIVNVWTYFDRGAVGVVLDTIESPDVYDLSNFQGGLLGGE